jgi:hypothetical protein
VGNGSLWGYIVFEKEVIFHEFDFETSDLEFKVSKSSIWKHTTSCDKGVFFFHYYLATSTTNWAQIFTGLLFYACLDTPGENTGLWQFYYQRKFWSFAFEVFKYHMSIIAQNLKPGMQLLLLVTFQLLFQLFGENTVACL